MKLRSAHFLLILVVAALALTITGCASTESDNASARPWNSPEGWQGGALNGLMDQQHR